MFEFAARLVCPAWNRTQLDVCGQYL